MEVSSYYFDDGLMEMKDYVVVDGLLSLNCATALLLSY